MKEVSEQRSAARRGSHRLPAADQPPWIEPGLSNALARLSPMQRQVVVLVEAFGWTHREAAELLGVGASTVLKHLERGLVKLRAALGVGTDV